MGRSTGYMWALFVVGLLWFTEFTTLIDLADIINFEVPWAPLVLILVSLKYITEHYR